MGSTSGQELEELWSQIRHHPTNQFHAAFNGQRGPHRLQDTDGISGLPRFKVVLKDGVLKCFGMGFGAPR